MRDTARRFRSAIGEECPICYEGFDDDHPKVTPCLAHSFHKECIERWCASAAEQRRTCPMCRQPLDLTGLDCGVDIVQSEYEDAVLDMDFDRARDILATNDAVQPEGSARHNLVHEAIEVADMPVLEFLVTVVDVDEVQHPGHELGETYLIWAVQKGNPDIIDLLVQRSSAATVQHRDDDMSCNALAYLLMHSTEHNHALLPSVRSICSKGDLNKMMSERYSSNYSTGSGEIKMVNGFTLLHLATLNDNIEREVVQFFREHTTREIFNDCLTDANSLRYLPIDYVYRFARHNLYEFLYVEGLRRNTEYELVFELERRMLRAHTTTIQVKIQDTLELVVTPPYGVRWIDGKTGRRVSRKRVYQWLAERWRRS